MSRVVNAGISQRFLMGLLSRFRRLFSSVYNIL